MKTITMTEAKLSAIIAGAVSAALMSVQQPKAVATTKATAKPIAKPVAKATAKPIAKPVAKATAKPIAKPIAKATARIDYWKARRAFEKWAMESNCATEAQLELAQISTDNKWVDKQVCDLIVAEMDFIGIAIPMK